MGCGTFTAESQGNIYEMGRQAESEACPKTQGTLYPPVFSQEEEGVDYGETFAPVVKLVTLRIFLSIVANPTAGDLPAGSEDGFS